AVLNVLHTTVAEIMKRRFSPAVVTNRPWECFHFAGHEIKITEATECYGAIVWPSALVLCHFLETNAKQYSLVDKSVIEIGAGTGLVSIVATLLGAHVTATDLPEVLGNLQYNILKKYQMKCKHHLCVILTTSWLLMFVYYHPSWRSCCLPSIICVRTTLLFSGPNEIRPDTFRPNLMTDFRCFDLWDFNFHFPSLNITLYKAMRRGKKMM
uniref:Uncharacterized protein n=1 Tax=Chelonoidis abingdonii TaxID=106734 RepID=A0A8C0GPR3_CHEAB